MTNSTYLSCKDTAKLVRAALKKNFPGVKFSVRSDNNSLRIEWMDGPLGKSVDAIVKNYEGGRFDGMIDMAYNVTSWLMPDGSAIVAHNPGSAGSRGVDEGCDNAKPHPDAKQVRFGANYVFTQRLISPTLKTAALARVCTDYVVPGDVYVKTSDYDGTGQLSADPLITSGGCDDYLSSLVYRQLVNMGATRQAATHTKPIRTL